MYNFHYNTIENNFKNNYDLIYSDTDSLVYYIRHKNFYKWLFENSEEFDLSNLTGKFKKEENNGVLGKMKNETGNKVITEFLALSPKSYAYKYCGKETKKAKGVALAVSEKRWISTTIIEFLSRTTRKQDRFMESGPLTSKFFQRAKIRWFLIASTTS